VQQILPGNYIGGGSMSMLSPKDIKINKRGTSIENFGGLEKNSSIYDGNTNRQTYSSA
jgi:hypothetical protein